MPIYSGLPQMETHFLNFFALPSLYILILTPNEFSNIFMIDFETPRVNAGEFVLTELGS